ncbi:MAG TPA: hypothetical protein VF682_13795 [Pseudomonas sp.]|jgi:hypothetical protein|uniref:Uncharacterized protein n=1 Tax=Pseudomonas haemolytica TaxID=2600065 RepID=A0ABS1H1E6_9PSED|nr:MULTISPECIES: hypothetical protein [Pseudomonas]MBJ2249513.1 hypothetical protein [Pseudomonas haemolytica]MBK3462945.1 hypothetical protein [Pseudomonas haemolytica]MBX9407940.1 hypothetical protein [Pseudomonas baetica]NMX62479.1 hypothetical protein [Pseudomonas sp. WS 5079]NMX73274.1 hypothetical protein [Pseudomonas sp. WS 5532]
MWWLLVPLIGAVVAAVASSDDEEKEAAERRARIQTREAEAQAIARRKQANLEKRKAQLVADVDGQLKDLFATHPAVLDRTNQGALHVSFDSLSAFVIKKVPNKPKAMLKHLDTIAPGAAFSPIWVKQAVQAHALQKEITGLQRLKEELLG